MPILCERSACGVCSHLWRERCRRLVRKLLDEDVADGEHEHSLPHPGECDRGTSVPHHNRGTVHAHTRHVSQRSARAVPTGPFDETSAAAAAGIRSIFMGFPQRPLRGSGRFALDSRTRPLRERPRSHLNEHEVSVCLEIAVVISEDQLLDQWPRRVRFRCGRCSPPQPHPPHLHFRIPSAPHRGRHGFADFLLSKLERAGKVGNLGKIDMEG